MFLDLVREVAGIETQEGTEARFACPFCADDKRRLYLDTESNVWHCFHCDKAGNSVSFTKEVFEVNYRDALEILKTFDCEPGREHVAYFSKYGDSLTDAEKLFLAMHENDEEEETVEVVKTCPAFPIGYKPIIPNFNEPEARPFIEYLANRNVSYEDVEKHMMCYVVEGTVQRVGKTPLNLRNHIVFPTFNDDGSARYWNTRSIEPDAYVKAYNAPSEPHEYGKRDSIFNINQAQYTDKLIICEGVFDALTCGPSGIATFGKQVTDEQVLLIEQAIAKNPTLKVYIFLDRDAVEQGDKLAKQLLNTTQNVYLVNNTMGGDANDLGSESVTQLIEHAEVYTPASSLKYMLGFS